MSNYKKRKNVQPGKPNNQVYIMIGVIAVLVSILVTLIVIATGNNDGTKPGEDIVIIANEITETARFYPYKIGNTDMEIFAARASDNTIRTAFNTCQVCYDSGRGYYVQEGDEFVCQNCGNRFKLDQIEVIKGGCNPVPIMKENKVDDGTTITISGEFLASYKELFGNWNKP